jgi:hypothetical protein
MQRLSEVDITNYVLNELEPSERLFVESLMLGCDESRKDALAMMETARLLEEGLEKELSGMELELDQPRRERIFAYKSGSVWGAVGHVASTLAALAACVAFSLAAPTLSRLALGRDGAKAQTDLQTQQGGDALRMADILDPGAFPTFANDSSEPSVGSLPSEDLPTRVLFPTGAVNFVEMPLPALGGDTN